MVMAEDCIKGILMFLSRESNFTGNKLVNQPQTNSVFYYTGRFAKDEEGNITEAGVNFHLQKSLTLGMM